MVHSEEMVYVKEDNERARILAGYRELPTLRLTAAQASRLWAINRHHCEHHLRALVDVGLLRLTADLRYAVSAAAARGWHVGVPARSEVAA